MRSAVDGDPAPILRLENLASESNVDIDIEDLVSTTVFVTTLCTETPLPWTRDTQDRAGAIRDAAAAIPAYKYAPFSRAALEQGTFVSLCQFWPDGPSAVKPSGPMPDVPALILSGRGDVRTPLEDAREMAAQMPRAKVVSVPNSGHSVLTTAPCAARAMRRFMTGQAVGKPCQGAKREGLFSAIFRVGVRSTAPTKLSQLTPARKIKSRPGRTLQAISSTFFDLTYSIVYRLDELFESALSKRKSITYTGLRRGYVRYRAGKKGTVMQFKRFTYIPGVELNGAIRYRNSEGNGDQSDEPEAFGSITIRGGQAANGRLRFKSDGSFSGRLGGKRVRYSAAELKKLNEDFSPSSVGGQPQFFGLPLLK